LRQKDKRERRKARRRMGNDKEGKEKDKPCHCDTHLQEGPEGGSREL